MSKHSGTVWDTLTIGIGIFSENFVNKVFQKGNFTRRSTVKLIVHCLSLSRKHEYNRCTGIPDNSKLRLRLITDLRSNSGGYLETPFHRKEESNWSMEKIVYKFIVKCNRSWSRRGCHYTLLRVCRTILRLRLNQSGLHLWLYDGKTTQGSNTTTTIRVWLKLKVPGSRVGYH